MTTREVGAFDAKTHLPKLLDQVAAGERILITRRGKRVAMLVPLEDAARLDSQSAGERLRELRRGLRWAADGDFSLRDAIDAGRR